MTELKMKTVVGETFEELTAVEMTKVQGFGDVSPETTPIYCAFATLASSI